MSNVTKMNLQLKLLLGAAGEARYFFFLLETNNFRTISEMS